MFDLQEELKKLPAKPGVLFNARQKRCYYLCGQSG